MDTQKNLISLAVTIVVCICFCYKTPALAATKGNNQKKQTKPSKSYARSAKFRSVLRNKAVYKQLQQNVDLSALTQHTTFGEAIEILSNSIEPSLKIVVMWRDLSDNADIEQDTTIMVDGVSGIKLSAGLDILLRAVSNQYAKLGYIVKDGIIIIATKDSLPIKMRTRVYDISDLVAMPARFGFIPAFGGGYYGQRGQIPTTTGNGRPAYNRSNRTRAGRGTTAVWGLGRNNRRAGQLAGVVRQTVRPSRWR